MNTEKTFYQKHLKNKSSDELLNQYSHTTDSNSKDRNALLMAFTYSISKDINSTIQNLIKSIDDNSTTTHKLSSRLIFLNIILTILTLVILIFAILSYFN